MSAGLLRNRYVSNTAATATPAQLVTMLYDRLLLDVARGEAAQRAGDRAAAGAQLVHAQDIVFELMSSLRTDEWDGGPALLSLYVFLHAELVRANIDADADRTAGCRKLIEPLRDAWAEAAADVMRSGAAVTVGSP